MSKAKRWCFTSYNVDSPPVYDESVCEYLVYGKETCPDTSRIHLQGFVCFTNRKTLAGCKTWCAGAHFERARGTPKEASQYCKKDGDYQEFGSLPADSRGAGGFKDLLDKASKGEIAAIKEAYPGHYLRYKAAIFSSIEFDTSPLENSCGVWICGPPRCGKDYGVRNLAKEDLYCKPINKWWDGYRNQSTVLISDVEPDHGKWLGYFLKIWMDCYPFTAEIKGGSMLIRPKAVFVTSNFRMDEVFSGPVLEALKCRCNVYDFYQSPVEITKRMQPVATSSVLDVLLQNEDTFRPTEIPTREAETTGQASSPPSKRKAAGPSTSSESSEVHSEELCVLET